MSVEQAPHVTISKFTLETHKALQNQQEKFDSNNGSAFLS